ncbi:hypothetical protein BS78_02G173300 [Paspalum vaginatum]|nr:hypothetical protein BS78_02G173300 [Paspalum vaginatum]
MVGAAPAAAPSVASRVEKATSHLLMGPDWAQTKDVVKAVKKRLQNKDPKLLETMMKNCGEYVQFEVAEQHVLQEMVKIIQKKNDMQVRDKILLLLDSWQEAFGGPGSKYPQYHWAYLEVKTTGIVFSRHPIDAPPIFTPATHNSQTYGSPRYAAGSLSDRMFSDIQNVTDLLNDMVHVLNPSDRTVVDDEIITDLVTQCRTNQQKLLQFVSSTGGLEINDLLQNVLSKYDAVASGAPLAVEAPVGETIETPREAPAVKPSTEHNDIADEEEDEFTQLAQRKNKSVVNNDDALSSTGDLALVPIDQEVSEPSSSVASNALQPAVIQNQNGPQQPTNGQQYPSDSPQYPTNYQPHTTNQGYVPPNNYVTPWAQTGAYPPQPPAYASGYGYLAQPWAAPTHPTVDSNPFLSASCQDPRPAAAPNNISVGSPPNNGLTATQAQMNVNQQTKDSSTASSRPYYIPDNLFSDLIDTKNFGVGSKMAGPTTMGSSDGSQPMIGGKK